MEPDELHVADTDPDTGDDAYDPEVTFNYHGRPSNVLSTTALGYRPYVLVTVDVTDPDVAAFDLTTGGGAPTDPAATLTFLDMARDLLKQAIEVKAAEELAK